MFVVLAGILPDLLLNATALNVLLARLQNEASPRALAEHLADALVVPPDLVPTLYTIHQRQWTLEDLSRADGADPGQLSVVKREIDDCNARRHQLINTIDTRVTVAVGTAPLRFYSETVGELIDRLLILELKLTAAAGPTRDAVIALVDHLAVTVAQLVGDIISRRAALPRRVGYKIYGGEVA